MGSPPKSPRICLAVLALAAASAAAAQDWTAKTVEQMVEHAQRLTPPGLGRQIERHMPEMKRGVRLAGQSVSGGAALEAPLGDIIRRQTDVAIRKIEEHQAFSEIVFQMGIVSYFVALANDPVRFSPEDRPEPAYAADYYGYLEDASPRFAVLYYADGRNFETTLELDQLIQRSLARGRTQAAMVAQEYRRIGSIEGRRKFDDRSTAFGVGSLAFSHAVSDIIGVLRYIWIRAGGGDFRNLPPLGADHLILLSPGTPLDAAPPTDTNR